MSASARNTLAVGTDLVLVDDVRASIDRFGARYLSRVYTVNELSDCSDGQSPTQPCRLAARFAAKEAVRKALRLGDVPIELRAIEVRRHAEGWCEIVLHRDVALLAERAGVTSIALSMSHEGAYASAVVVAQMSGTGAEADHG